MQKFPHEGKAACFSAVQAIGLLQGAITEAIKDNKSLCGYICLLTVLKVSLKTMVPHAILVLLVGFCCLSAYNPSFGFARPLEEKGRVN